MRRRRSPFCATFRRLSPPASPWSSQITRDRAWFIHGNADRELVSHYDGTSDVRQRVEEADIWVLRGEWAARQLTETQRDFLAGLPETVALDVEGLGQTLFCHGSPRSDEEIVTRITPERRLREVLDGVKETVVVCGHTHVQFDRAFDGKRIINAGSVGMPYEREAAAYWVLLGPDVSLRRTNYDVEDAAARFRASAFPEADEFVTESLLNPPDPDETSEFFEKIAEERAGPPDASAAPPPNPLMS
jgi:diadenosine tetraphosphatase ApaH/serine/threonine PP2A family protein phosphatase